MRDDGNGQSWRELLSIGAAFALYWLMGWVINFVFYPQLDAIFYPAKGIATISGAVVGLIITWLAVTRPRTFGVEKAWSIPAIAVYVLAVGATQAGITNASTFLVVAGTLLMSACMVWLSILLGVALLALPRRRMLLAIVGATVVRHLFSIILAPAPQALLVAIACVAPVGIYLLLLPYLAGPLHHVADAPAQSALSVTNPSSFLPFSHLVFVTILLFSVANGFAITFASTPGATPQQSALTALPFIALLLVCLVRRGPLNADSLYLLATLLVVAGFLLVPVEQVDALVSAPLVNVLVKAGSDLFIVVMYYLLGTLAGRNELAVISLFAFGGAARGLGTEIGARIGDLAGGATMVSVQLTAWITAAFILLFVAYNLYMTRHFSFEDTIDDVHPVEPLVTTEDHDVLEDRCATVARRCGLTAREAEVLLLLARGRNAQSIQDKLVVSRSTAKTHVRNIYGKLGVHTQQDLIDLVEGADGPDSPALT